MSRARQGRKGARLLASQSRWSRDQRGITLLELTVVAAILSILAALVAVGVSGKATESRESTRGSDLAEIQKGVNSFSGEHPQSRYPTINGCLPAEAGQAQKVLDLVTRRCVPFASVTDALKKDDTLSATKFLVVENQVGVDLDGDGVVGTASLTVAPIVWAKSFTTTEGLTKSFVPSYLAQGPKHAFELFSGPANTWKSDLNTEPELTGGGGGGTLPATLPAPPGSITAPLNRTTPATGNIPVWVLDSKGRVLNLLPDGRY